MAECELFQLIIRLTASHLNIGEYIRSVDLNCIHIPALMNNLTCNINKHISINLNTFT